MKTGMAEKQVEKTEKVEDGKGTPPPAEPDRVTDHRLFPGGSPKGAELQVGINAVDKTDTWIDDVQVPGVKSVS
jgi:hypothetical protein